MNKQIESYEAESEAPEISINISGGELFPEDLESADTTLVGERFGTYLIVGEIAVGGMAEVFLAVQRGLESFQKVVVIKRVLPAYSSNPSFVKMFVDEARLTARLEHPNLIRTYEFGEVGGQYFTAMEYLPGEDLAKTLDRLAFAQQQVPLYVAAGIVTKVCAGLHFAHQLTDTSGHPLRLIHRDINPANIIVTYTGEVKIIDFGIAKTSASETQTGTLKGKLAYMSPEQLLGRGVDQRSDVFSTGVVLWELITGRPLFLRDNEAATLYAIMNEPIVPPSRYRADVPLALDEIAMHALARTPADRYDSAEEMELELERFLATQPTFDGRAAARMLEGAFGPTRARAKRAIAQSRSLARNIAAVMKLRTDVSVDVADALDQGSAPREILAEPEPHRAFAVMLALVMLLGIAGGVIYLVRGDREPETVMVARPALQLASDPAGAAITLDGEPTGLKTPATLTLAAGKVTIRLELAGYRAVTETIDLPASGLTRRVALVR
ncbi:MAG: serine/threonine-protein kinase [Kofleriaceae bacterium]